MNEITLHDGIPLRLLTRAHPVSAWDSRLRRIKRLAETIQRGTDADESAPDPREVKISDRH